MVAPMSGTMKTMLIASFLITGSINTLTKKFQFQTCGVSPYLNGHLDPSCADKADCPCPAGSKDFDKPWSQNILMFLGESFLLFLFCYSRSRSNVRELARAEAGEAPSQQRPPFYIFLLPASCDVLGTGVGGIGMLYISAAVWQMMRGSLIIFTSILSVVILKKKLRAHNWIAVLTSACGLCLIGISAIVDEGPSSSGNVPMGILFTVLSQFFAASQMVIEELFVKGYGAPPEQVVGFEGFWGILIMIVLLLIFYSIPGKDAGSYENIFDSLEMIKSSGSLIGFMLLYLVSIACFNFLGITITGRLSALHRTINDALRTAIVWGVQTALFYGGATQYGAPLKAHSWMQGVGFIFLIMGSVINHAVIKLPCVEYPDMEHAKPAVGRASISVAGVSLISPADQGEA